MRRLTRIFALATVSALAISGCAGPEQTVAEPGDPVLHLACVNTGGTSSTPAPQQVEITRDGDALVANVDLAGAEFVDPEYGLVMDFEFFRYSDAFEHPDLRASDGVVVKATIFPEAALGDEPAAVSINVTTPDQEVDTRTGAFELTDSGFSLRASGAAEAFDLFGGAESPTLDLTQFTSFSLPTEERVRCGTGFVGTADGFLQSGEVPCILVDSGRPESVGGESLGSFEVHEDGSVTITRSDQLTEYIEVVTDVPGRGEPLGLDESVTLQPFSEGTPDIPSYSNIVMLSSPPMFCSSGYVPSPDW